MTSDVNRALLHFDFGNSVILPGNPSVHSLWVDGLMWDLWLITGGLLIGAFERGRRRHLVLAADRGRCA